MQTPPRPSISIVDGSGTGAVATTFTLLKIPTGGTPLGVPNDKNVRVSEVASAVNVKDSEIQLEWPLLDIVCRAVVWLDPPNETLNCSV